MKIIRKPRHYCFLDMKQQKNDQIITFKQISCCFQIPLEILNVYCGKIYTIIVNKRSGEHLSFA